MSEARDLTKRAFDISLSFALLFACGWLIAIAWLIAATETRSNGFFTQVRIGRYGRPFRVVKIKTMKPDQSGARSPIASSNEGAITLSGRWLRRLKIDELPQLWNVLTGSMSFVGPRPDVPGYADRLQGSERVILKLRPGITGPASLKYRDEEEILRGQSDPKRYNDEVIWPDKVRLNIEYYYRRSIALDLYYIIRTIRG